MDASKGDQNARCVTSRGIFFLELKKKNEEERKIYINFFSLSRPPLLDIGNTVSDDRFTRNGVKIQTTFVRTNLIGLYLWSIFN